MKIKEKGGSMLKERRKFLKTTLSVGALGVGMLVSVKSSVAAEKEESFSNGVVTGHSPHKEILYRKTADWDIYYKAAY
jgi:hypothetical protein